MSAKLRTHDPSRIT